MAKKDGTAPQVTVRDASTADLARAWGITPQAIHRLAAKGMPHVRLPPAAGRPKQSGEMRFNLAEAAAWRRKNSTGSGNGGKREKRGSGHRAVGSGEESVPTPLPNAHAPMPSSGPWTRDSAGVQRALEDEEEREQRGSVIDEGLEEESQAKLWCILQAEKIRMARVERAIKEQKYVKADDAMKVFTFAARGAAKELRGMGRSLAARIVSRLGVATTPENTTVVREIIDQLTDHISEGLTRCNLDKLREDAGRRVAEDDGSGGGSAPLEKRSPLKRKPRSR